MSSPLVISSSSVLSVIWPVGLSALAVLVGYIWLFCRYPERKTGLVKSPAGIPVLGHVSYLHPDNFVESMQSLTQTHGPVFELYAMKSRFVIVCDIPSIKEVLLKRPKVFRREHNLEHPFAVIGMLHSSLFSAEGHTWGRLRKLMSAPFNKQNVIHMLPLIQKEIDAMLLGLEETNGETVDHVGTDMMHFTLRTILRVALDAVEVDEYLTSNQVIEDVSTMFVYITKNMLTPIPKWLWDLYPPEIEKRALAANARMDSAVGKIVKNEIEKIEREKGSKQSITDSKPKRSFIEILLAETEGAQQSSADGDASAPLAKLTAAELVANIKTMIFAGSETTSVSLTWALHYLSINKTHFDSAREEADKVLGSYDSDSENPPHLPFCAACFKEVQRFKGAAMLLGASLVDEVNSHTLPNGVEIRPFDTIFCGIEHVMTDPELFPNPFEFDPLRWLTCSNSHLEKMNSVFFAFGYGSRICPGMFLAKLEGELALAHIVKKFDLRPECKPEDVKRVIKFTVQAERVPMRFVKRIDEALI